MKGSSTVRRRSDRFGRVATWLCGGALAFNLLMIGGLLVLLAYMGMGTFWQRGVAAIELKAGGQVWGELHDRVPVRASGAAESGAEAKYRLVVKRGNKELHGIAFEQIEEARIEQITYPDDLVMLERREGGTFYGKLVHLEEGGARVEGAAEAQWQRLQSWIDEKHAEHAAIRAIERGVLDDLNREMRDLALQVKSIQMADLAAGEEKARIDALEAQRAKLLERAEAIGGELREMRDRLADKVAVFAVSDGSQRSIQVAQIVQALRPNRLDTGDKIGLYVSNIWGFLTEYPRAGNTEGGIFPALFGTVLMVFLMTFVVTPFGVLAALYLREYAKEGLAVRVVRIAVNNLAGVPSIVFGVFGLGFFVYFVGGTIDQLFYPESLPSPTFGTPGILWAAATLALLTVPVVIVATEEGLAAVPKIVRQGSLALGATKFETTYKVVVPAAAPGILTGVILAIARAAGEVAPLMIVGVIRHAPELPLDRHFPFLHVERKFMHLGFHIYDVGFQSPDSESTRPLVYATALLLVVLVTAMNLVAIAIRNHLRKRYATSAV